MTSIRSRASLQGLLWAMRVVMEHWHILLQATVTITTFTLMCVDFAHPSARERLWQVGGVNGWNSDPSMRIYFYANHEEPPEIPLIWSQQLTSSTLAIATLSVALTFQRAFLSALGFELFFFAALSDIIMAGFWSYSVSSQMSSDMTDVEHVALRPWYLERGCQVASSRGDGAVGACRMAQAGFALAVVSLMFYASRAAISISAHIYSAGRQHTFIQIHEKELMQHSWEVARHRRTRSYSRVDFDWTEGSGEDEKGIDPGVCDGIDKVDVELGLYCDSPSLL